MGMPVKAEETQLTCEEVSDLQDAYLTGALSAEQKAAVDDHCAHCKPCRDLLAEEAGPQPLQSPAEPPMPPRYLAAQIKSEARQRRSPERAAARKRMIGSPSFLAVCAVIAAGVIATLAVTYHMNNVRLREDTSAPAFVVTSGGGVITLTDPEDPMREQTADELLEKLRRGKEDLEQAQAESQGVQVQPGIDISSEAPDTTKDEAAPGG